MQNWFLLSDPARVEAWYEFTSLWAFTCLGWGLSQSRPTFRQMCEASDLVGRIVKQANAHLTRKGSLLKGRSWAP